MKKVTFSGIVGNEKLISYLSRSVSTDTLPHAFILEGAPGTGRHTILTKLLCALACESEDAPCGVCGNCMKISSGGCVDVHYIRKEPDKASLGIDPVREVTGEISLMPNDLDFHVFVVEDAQLMTEPAQNAFLKTLEEPPCPAYFFLITTSAASLLPTVRSRAIPLHTERLSNEQIAAYVRDKTGVSEKKALAAAVLSDGSIGGALDLLSDEKNDIVAYRKAADTLINAMFSEDSGMTQYGFMNLVKKYVTGGEALKYILRFLASAVRDIEIKKRGINAELCCYADDEKPEELSYAASQSSLMALSDYISEMYSRTDVPTSATTTAAELACGLWERKSEQR